MKILWLTILSAIVVALASLYLASRPSIDRSLVNQAPATPVEIAGEVASPAKDVATRAVDVMRGSATNVEATPPAQTSPSRPPPASAPPPVVTVTARAANTAGGAGSAAPQVRGSPSQASAGPQQAPSPRPVAAVPEAAPSSAPVTAPAPLPRLPRSADASQTTGRLAALGPNEARSAANRQAAQCRALTAYLQDLDIRAARAGNAGETTMLVEQRRITNTRQRELGCEG